MELFSRFYLDKEKDIIVELYRRGDVMDYILRTPNHDTGNLITNLARLCELPLGEDEQGLKVIRGTVPCYVDGDNRRLYIFRMGNTKIANIYPDGSVEMKASIPAISKALMSQTKDYRLSVARTIVKTYIFDDCKFHTDLHTHMSANLPPDVLIALGIRHQIRYPLYYIRKLGLRVSPKQRAAMERASAAAAEVALADSPLTGKYRERRIDDNTFLNFADLILGNLPDAAWNIARSASHWPSRRTVRRFSPISKRSISTAMCSPRALPRTEPDRARNAVRHPDEAVAARCAQMLADREDPDYRGQHALSGQASLDRARLSQPRHRLCGDLRHGSSSRSRRGAAAADPRGHARRHSGDRRSAPLPGGHPPHPADHRARRGHAERLSGGKPAGPARRGRRSLCGRQRYRRRGDQRHPRAAQRDPGAGAHRGRGAGLCHPHPRRRERQPARQRGKQHPLCAGIALPPGSRCPCCASATASTPPTCARPEGRQLLRTFWKTGSCWNFRSPPMCV